MKCLILAALVAFVSSQNGPTGPGIVDRRCPAGSPDPPLHLNDPEDCSNFFQCANGLAVPFRCPAGQHWSIDLDRCDWPEVANCEKGNSCPPGDPTPPVMLPFPGDCTRFIKCSWGIENEMRCPSGQEWDQTNQWCDWPEYKARANCDSGNGGKDSGEKNSKEDSKEKTAGRETK